MNCCSTVVVCELKSISRSCTRSMPPESRATRNSTVLSPAWLEVRSVSRIPYALRSSAGKVRSNTPLTVKLELLFRPDVVFVGSVLVLSVAYSPKNGSPDGDPVPNPALEPVRIALSPCSETVPVTEYEDTLPEPVPVGADGGGLLSLNVSSKNVLAFFTILNSSILN